LLEAQLKFLIVAQTDSSFLIFLRDEAKCSIDPKTTFSRFGASRKSSYRFIASYEHNKEQQRFDGYPELPDHKPQTPISIV
jgi:hypothetical protein